MMKKKDGERGMKNGEFIPQRCRGTEDSATRLRQHRPADDEAMTQGHERVWPKKFADGV